MEGVALVICELDIFESGRAERSESSFLVPSTILTFFFQAATKMEYIELTRFRR